MPTILETDIGEFEFPNDLTIDQINEWERNEFPSLRERLGKGVVRDLASRFPRDVAVSGSETIMGAARGAQLANDFLDVYNIQQAGLKAAMSAPVGEEHAAITAAHQVADAKAKELESTREQRLAQNPVYKFGEQSKKNAVEFYQTNPTREGSIPAMLSQGVASTVPVIASGVAGPLAPAVAAVTYGAMAGQQGAEEAIAMGHPDKADEAFLLFAGLGALSEAALGYPIAFLRKVAQARQSGVQPQVFRNALQKWLNTTTGGRITREALEGFGREYFQEGTEQGGQNVVAGPILGYDPDRPLMQNVPQSAAIGGVVGGVTGGIGGAAMAIDQARARRAAEAQIPAILRSIETPQPIVRPEDMTPEQAAAQEQAIADFLRDRPTTAPAPPAPEPPRFQPPLPQPAPEPVPAEKEELGYTPTVAQPRRRSPIVPEPERPRFRPPSGRDLTGQPEATTKSEPVGSGLVVSEAQQKGVVPVAQPVTVPSSEASAGLKALPVGEETGPTTRSGPPPAKAEEGARETGIQSPVRENGAQTSLVLKDGTAIVGGRIHAETFAEAEKRGIKTEDLLDSTSAFTRPDGTSWNLQGTPVQVTKILRLDDLPPQPQGVQDALRQRISETPNVRQTPEAREEVGAQVRDAGRPAVPQTETPQAQGQVATKKRAKSPKQVQTQAQEEVQEVAQVQGPRAAKEIKSELVARLEEALVDAPPASDFAEPEKITVEIPGDGTFTILKTKEAIEEVLKRARRLSTSTSPPKGYTERGVTREQAKQFADEARMSPEEIEAFRPGAKYSVTLQDQPAAQVSAEDIERAFPASQGFQVKAFQDRATGLPVYYVKLPNSSSILINPHEETIAFDARKGAADWGLNPSLAEQGRLVAAGRFFKIEGLSKAGFIDLINTAGPDTLSHEKFHALFELALTADERSAILNRYKTEEKAAEAFRRSEGFTRGFWDKMRRFIEWLANLVRGDAFRKLRLPLSAEPSQPTGRTEPQYSLEDVFRSKRSLEDFIAKPTISPEEATSLRQQAGAGAGLVPDAIAQEIEELQAAASDTVEGRMATLLDFVLKLHGVAPALELQKILFDANIAEDVKQAAISNVLRQIEHVRIKTTDLEEKLREANAKLANAIKNGPKITKERLVEARAKQIADNLITGYRAYLTAQAANLPANQNLAAARADAIRGLQASIAKEEKYPDQAQRALEAIAERIDELPVSQGPQAVIDAIRSKGILKGKVSDTLIDLLTAEVDGFSPLLLNPTANQMLIELAELKKKAETYAKQIEVIEKAFQGKAPGSPSSTSRFYDQPTQVELKKFADTYRKFRNTQQDAAKAIREMDQQIREADEDVQVYGRSTEILTRLQNDPQFRQQFETAISRPGGEIFRDIISAKNPELEKVYTSPLVQTNEDGKQFQNEYRIYLAPDRVADDATLRDMQMLVAEIDEFLQGDVNPVERQTWETRRDYIVKYLLQPKFSQKTQILQFGRVNVNPFSVVQLIAGGRARGPRSELEKMAFRAANEANTTFRVADQALVGYKFIGNNTEFGDAATKVAILKAVESHGWSTDRITFWDENVLNPILASGQTTGQMRLKAGDFIPGTGIKITKEDMEVAQKQKRYSQGIVQTTQGTAKGLPGLLIENPVLIKTTILGRKALRGALSPGRFTMARRFSTWSKLFADAWTKATPSGRRRMVTDGEHFQKAVLGYVSTTNPEFANDSSLKSVYETFVARAKENEDYQVQSLDQLLDRLAAIAVEKGLFPSVAEALPQIEQTLLSEVGRHVASIQKHFAEEGYTDDTPQTVMQYASAKSAFTTERKNMLAPDPYYDYTLTHDSDRIGFVAAGYQQFQLRQIDALKALKVALDKKEGEFAEEIGRLRHKGMSRRKSAATVQKKSETQLDRSRFSMLRLHAHKRVIDKVLKDLSENVIDVRDPNDSAVLLALSRVTANLSSSLLSSPTAIANNLFGGIAANSVILRNLGRASLVGTPVKATAHTTGALVKKVLLTFAPKTLIGRVARSNMPIVNDMAAMVDNQIRNWTQQYLEMQERGLVAPTDMRNRMRAQSALRGSAGAIEREPTPLIAAIPNWLESLPGLQQFIGHLRDKVPRLGDEVVNMGAAGVQTSEIFDFLKLQAVKAFEAREAAGDDINAVDYFASEANLLSPKELGMVESTGFRDSDSLRQMFEIVGNLDGFLRDYYNRQKAAPDGQKHAVPLFENPADEGAVLYDMNAHGNIPTAGFTPPSMAGVGQRGLIKKMLFMFQNYVLRQAAQAERLADKDLRDPKGWREAYALWGIFATLIVWALAGMLATETGVPATQLITGRSPSRVTAANVIADPDAAMLARYVGMALGNNLPYYGQVLSQVLGNPGYGSKWDAANLIPIAGLVRDVNTAITRIGQTGDAILPGADFVGRWFPPASPAFRLFPSVSGDIERRNTERALRVIGPSAGMELAGGGGGTAVQTPASAAVRRLISAAYRGDQEAIRSAFDEAVREKAAQGSADPERSVMQSLASAIPARRVYGKSITPAEEAQLIGKMSAGQRAAYAKGQDAFDLINQTLGTRLSLTSEPRARSTTRSQPTRRALFPDSAGPIFASRRSRRRRIGGRRRSAFSRLQIRGASRRRRRSPARTSFAA